MEFFILEPEVAGGLVPRTAIRDNTRPPIIDHLHYVFDGWLGDALVESFPVFLVTKVLKNGIAEAGFGGAAFDFAEIEMSGQFAELEPGCVLPEFSRLLPVGVAGADDFACAQDGRLVVSARALALLQDHGIDNALIEPFVG